MLIHGARAVIRFAENKPALSSVEGAEPNQWLCKLIGRRNKNVAAVALANKNARIIWALLAKGKIYERDYVSVTVRIDSAFNEKGFHRLHGQS